MKMDSLETLRILWDHLYTEDVLEKADIIMAFGCADPDVAQRAARLFLDGYAPWLLFSGGLGKGTEGRLCRSEAEEYSSIAEQEGVPKEKILLEAASTNTGENVHFSFNLLQERGIQVAKAIVVHQPNMGKRICATLQKQWPDQTTAFLVAPADRSLEAYMTRLSACGVDEYEMVSNIVGDFQRMDTYARMGYQTPVAMPQEAWAAFEQMKALGYTKYVIS